MDEFFVIASNWLSIGVAVLTVVVVFKNIAGPMMKPSEKDGFWAALGRILAGVAIQILFTAAAPIFFMLCVQIALLSWKTAMSMPVGQLIVDAGTETRVWTTDAFYALTGQNDKVINPDMMKLFPDLEKEEEPEGREIPSVEAPVPTDTPSPEVVPTLEDGQPTYTPTTFHTASSTIPPPPTATSTPTPSPEDIWDEVMAIGGNITSGRYAYDNLPSGSYQVSSSGNKRDITVMSGEWLGNNGEASKNFTLSRKATKELNNLLYGINSPMDKGTIFVIP